MFLNDLQRIATRLTTNAIGFVPISILPQLHQPEKNPKSSTAIPKTQ